MRLLFLDDDPDLRWAYAEMARLRGIALDSAATCEEARALLERTRAPYDLIVCDFNLAGGETAAAFVHDLESQGQSVVVVTGAPSQALEALGPDAYVLEKPLGFDELLERGMTRSRGSLRRAAG